jgi:hypothetical protein
MKIHINLQSFWIDISGVALKIQHDTNINCLTNNYKLVGVETIIEAILIRSRLEPKSVEGEGWRKLLKFISLRHLWKKNLTN